jgi:hypothetical protein
MEQLLKRYYLNTANMENGAAVLHNSKNAGFWGKTRVGHETIHHWSLGLIELSTILEAKREK